MAKKQKHEDYGQGLQEAYDRWAHLYEHGGSDPFYADGGNMNLVRNHIHYYRRMLEENPTLEGFPEIYYKDIPPEVDPKYMARADEIRVAAKAALEIYKADPNYRYIVQHYEDYTPKTRKKISLDNIIGYATGLEHYIKEDDLVAMRRHRHYEGYLESFADCAKKMQALPSEVNQQSMFTILNDPSAEADNDDFDDEQDDDNIERDFDENDFTDEPETEIQDEPIQPSEVNAAPETDAVAINGKKFTQTNIFDTLFPRKSYEDIQREEEESFEAKLAGLSFDEKVIARTHPWRINHAGNIVDGSENLVDTYAEIKEIAGTRKNLFKSDRYEIWCYEIPADEWDAEKKEYVEYIGQQLAFRIDNQIISLNFVVKNAYESDIFFPAMCMAYMDIHGNPLPFTIRDAFIEQGLGLLQHGEYRLGGKIKKDAQQSFSSLKTTLPKIINYLQAQMISNDFSEYADEKHNEQETEIDDEPIEPSEEKTENNNDGFDGSATVYNPAPETNMSLSKTEPLKVTKSEWDKISKEYKGEHTRSIWEFRDRDFPEDFIGKKNVIEQALPDSVFERSGRKKEYGRGSILITEGNGFEIISDEVIAERRSAEDNPQAVIITQTTKDSLYANIPDEIRSLNQWCVFRTYPDKSGKPDRIGKLEKVIISPVNSSFAHSDKPELWVNFKQAKAYAERYRHYKGLVFALSSGIVFIDIDHAIKDGVIVSEKAKQLLELLPDTYTEKSVSGTGIHILLKGSLPPDAYRRNDNEGIEMYDRRRFICMTGNTMNGSREIKDYSDRIAKIAYDFAGRRPPRTEYSAMPATQSDTALITHITNSRQGAKFQALYRGDTSAYPSHSHAESAMVFTLAWWTQNPAQIDSIVRSSGLIRPKWDERRGSGTYGSQLIDEALSTVQPPQRERNVQKQSYL